MLPYFCTNRPCYIRSMCCTWLTNQETSSASLYRNLSSKTKTNSTFEVHIYAVLYLETTCFLKRPRFHVIARRNMYARARVCVCARRAPKNEGVNDLLWGCVWYFPLANRQLSVSAKACGGWWRDAGVYSGLADGRVVRSLSRKKKNISTHRRWLLLHACTFERSSFAPQLHAYPPPPHTHGDSRGFEA